MKTSSTETTTIEVNALAKRFNREWIFRRFSFQFISGTTYAITGPNGSGKSTFLQVLWGQVPPTSGSMGYKKDGHIIPLEEVYNYIAVATPYMDIIEEFTLAEQIRFHFKMKALRPGLTEEAVMEKMGLTSARNKQIGNFSSGMRQRVKLGLAFSTRADIIFLDEPGTNLDKNGFAWYQKMLAEIQPSSLIFIASNDPQEYVTAHHTINIVDFK